MNLLLLAALAVLPTEWKNVQPFAVERAGLMKLSLPAETLDAARSGLEDLRVYDTAGREVPFLIERPTRRPAVLHAPKQFDVALAGSATVITLQTGLVQPVVAITLETPASGFIKAVKIEGSRDRQTWQTIADGKPIFRQATGACQLQINIPEGVWPWLRVTVDDRRAEAIPLTGARLHVISDLPVPEEAVPAKIVERIENDGQTRLTLDLGAAALTLAAVRLETSDALFTRPVSFAVRQVTENAITEQVLARDTIYRVEVEGFPRSDRTEVPLDLKVPGRELLVLIDNGDSPALTVTGVSVNRRSVYLVFLAAQPGQYRLYTGNPRCAAPRYDVAALGAKLKNAVESAIAISPLAGNPAYAPAETLPEIENLGAALAVTEWKYRKPVAIARAGVQQLELDLEVLAHAETSFRDLRLLRDGQQRPYILERTSIQRKLTPEVSPANDPIRPTVSRWQIKLPKARLPVTRLTCTTATPLFRRQVRLFERVADTRGEKYDRALGQAQWVRTPPKEMGSLGLTFDAAPVTDTFILETDNGDNPGIELANFAVYYPVTRVLFKAPAEPVTVLYYGNTAVNFPQYDLDLIAPRLLAEAKSLATLGAAEALKKSSVGELFALSGTKSLLFWGALAVVVVVLLVVIAKLLPKPPAT